tara:strand:- start:19771 stop:20712 length:942 start_codon:yes stop_codon:yes gene_type:complete
MRRNCTGQIASKTSKSVAAYGRRYRNLRLMAEREERAGGDIADVVAWFRSQNGRWKASTVRQYRSAIWHELDGTEMLSDLRAGLEMRLAAGPKPVDGGPKRTSSRKRKSLSVAELMKLDQHLKTSKGRYDRLLRCFLGFGVALFLRPVEYLSASVEGTILVVENAKATNGRANGKYRSRDISAMGADGIANLELFLRRIRKATAQAGGWESLHGRLASRLARVCKAVGVDRVSLYTLRHVGIASAKTWLEPYEVAAAAGHGSVRTATTHYAKSRTGWRGLRLAGKPLAESVDNVRGTFKRFQPTAREPVAFMG